MDGGFLLRKKVVGTSYNISPLSISFVDFFCFLGLYESGIVVLMGH